MGTERGGEDVGDWLPPVWGAKELVTHTAELTGIAAFPSASPAGDGEKHQSTKVYHVKKITLTRN